MRSGSVRTSHLLRWSEKDKAALLVIIGTLADGKKVFLACDSGYRESKESWSGVLRDLRGRGLRLGRLTIADGPTRSRRNTGRTSGQPMWSSPRSAR